MRIMTNGRGLVIVISVLLAAAAVYQVFALSTLAVSAPLYYTETYTETYCRNCHGNVADRHHLLAQNGTYQCTDCHAMKWDNDSQSYYPEVIRNCLNCHAGEIHSDCIACHVNGNPGDVNKTAFSQGVHVNINTSDGSGLVNNSDCWSCHFNRDMNRTNIRQCAECHTGGGIPEVPAAPRIRTHLSGVAITNYSCVDCHSKVIVDPGAGAINVTSHYLKRPTVSSVNYCDYCHGPDATAPFPATVKKIPEFKHDDPLWNGNATCRTCHSNSSVIADPLAGDSSSFHDLTTELGDVFNGTIKADCVVCHIQKSPYFVSAPNPTHSTTGMTNQTCFGCHGSGSGTQPQKLHSVQAIGGGCTMCHSNNATRYYVNTSIFGRHANVNTSDGSFNVTDADCKTCHFDAANIPMVPDVGLGAANSTNTYQCEDCHVSGGRNPSQYDNISSSYRKSQ
ncbi:MAG TPA: cytochrome c3 family protein, partial [Candidatus Methanoperedens sp.]